MNFKLNNNREKDIITNNGSSGDYNEN